ncbi:hypothetical protein Anapl_01074 [Anas platyrhynchos]|uniref:Uncharacterized protein n=1 Tax=Anas platyrhynchos TaxID=8839 RepID=R0KA44_ANAPL|nr:hypothetical protein Anapl_01074 [Anas platyrhynchos]
MPPLDVPANASTSFINSYITLKTDGITESDQGVRTSCFHGHNLHSDSGKGRGKKETAMPPLDVPANASTSFINSYITLKTDGITESDQGVRTSCFHGHNLHSDSGKGRGKKETGSSVPCLGARQPSGELQEGVSSHSCTGTQQTWGLRQQAALRVFTVPSFSACSPPPVTVFLYLVTSPHPLKLLMHLGEYRHRREGNVAEVWIHLTVRGEKQPACWDVGEKFLKAQGNIHVVRPLLPGSGTEAKEERKKSVSLLLAAAQEPGLSPGGVRPAGGKEHLFLSCCICTLLLHLWSPNIKVKPQEEEQLESRSSGGFSKQCALKVNPLPAFPSSSHPSGSPEVPEISPESQCFHKGRARVSLTVLYRPRRGDLCTQITSISVPLRLELTVIMESFIDLRWQQRQEHRAVLF